MFKKLTFPAIDLQDDCAVDKIYKNVLENKDRLDIDVIVFLLIDSSIIIERSTPISNLPIFMNDIKRGDVKNLVEEGIKSAKLSLANITDYIKTKQKRKNVN